MAEYIERTHAIASAVSGRIRALPTTEDGEDWIRVEEVRESLQSIPAADVAPVVHGRWVVKYEIWGKNVKTVEGYKCSKCGGFSFYQDNYCADCGARMDEVTE